MAAKAKKRKRRLSPAQVEAQTKRLLAELDERIDDRWDNFTKPILKEQSDSVRAGIDRMVQSMKTMAGPPSAVIRLDDEPDKPVRVNFDEATQEKDFKYAAVRMLVQAAELGIHVGDFTLPKKKCAHCGVKMK